MRVHLFML